MSLNSAGVRYLVVGGVAVVAHGYPRFTGDLDLVIALDMNNVQRALRALATLEYQPRIPVPAEQFADERLRRQWIEEKGMVVFSLASTRFPHTPVDLFAHVPFDFDDEYRQALWLVIEPALRVPVVRRACLIAMKKAAGRPQDLLDVAQLTAGADDAE